MSTPDEGTEYPTEIVVENPDDLTILSGQPIQPVKGEELTQDEYLDGTDEDAEDTDADDEDSDEDDTDDADDADDADEDSDSQA